MELRAGSRLKSVVCETEVIVVRAPTGGAEIWCGGHPMVPIDTDAAPGPGIDPGHDGGSLLGKRYADDELGLELLCTKAGKGSLSVSGAPLPLKEARPLPSSD